MVPGSLLLHGRSFPGIFLVCHSTRGDLPVRIIDYSYGHMTSSAYRRPWACGRVLNSSYCSYTQIILVFFSIEKYPRGFLDFSVNMVKQIAGSNVLLLGSGFGKAGRC